jgi:hypothetical protein
MKDSTIEVEQEQDDEILYNDVSANAYEVIYK